MAFAFFLIPADANPAIPAKTDAGGNLLLPLFP